MNLVRPTIGLSRRFARTLRPVYPQRRIRQTPVDRPAFTYIYTVGSAFPFALGGCPLTSYRILSDKTTVDEKFDDILKISSRVASTHTLGVVLWRITKH